MCEYPAYLSASVSSSLSLTACIEVIAPCPMVAIPSTSFPLIVPSYS